MDTWTLGHLDMELEELNNLEIMVEEMNPRAPYPSAPKAEKPVSLDDSRLMKN